MRKFWERGSGEPRITAQGVVLTSNTGQAGDFHVLSTSPLAANATFISSAFVIDQDMALLIFQVVTEAAGTLYSEYSMDAGVTWKPMGKVILAALSYSTAIGVLLIAPHVRVRYVNGAVAQTDFYFAAKY
jgi:hypothetical protein